MNAAVLVYGEIVHGEIAIPPGIESLEDFRRWAFSDEFPERGRIDYVDGVIEVEPMPERIISHGAVKAAVVRRLSERVLDNDLGNVYIDQTRVSSNVANLSAEPDVIVLLHDTIDSGQVRLVPTADGRDYREIEGGPDLIVEIVSPGSLQKDSQRLPAAYFAAGVREYWLIDARREVEFRIFRRGEREFVEIPADASGFVASEVLGRRYRFDREPGRREDWRYDLKEEPLQS